MKEILSITYNCVLYENNMTLILFFPFLSQQIPFLRPLEMRRQSGIITAVALGSLWKFTSMRRYKRWSLFTVKLEPLI